MGVSLMVRFVSPRKSRLRASSSVCACASRGSACVRRLPRPPAWTPNHRDQRQSAANAQWSSRETSGTALDVQQLRQMGRTLGGPPTFLHLGWGRGGRNRCHCRSRGRICAPALTRQDSHASQSRRDHGEECPFPGSERMGRRTGDNDEANGAANEGGGGGRAMMSTMRQMAGQSCEPVTER